MDQVKDYLLSHGAALVGYADIRSLPAETRDGLPSAVSFAVALDPRIVAGILGGPTAEYRDEYVRVNARIDELTAGAVAVVRAAGWRAEGRQATLDRIDPALEPIPLPHKTVARLAGLGWIGKCALLVTEDYGSAVRLGALVTDAPLPTAPPPPAEGRCGECMSCVRACPGHAPVGRNWQPGMARPDVLDARACYETIRRNVKQFGHGVCGMCIAVCPWTNRYLGRAGAV
jgi:epoxyqueuosine reductase